MSSSFRIVSLLAVVVVFPVPAADSLSLQYDRESTMKMMELQSDVSSAQLPPEIEMQVKSAWNSASVSVITLNESRSKVAEAGFTDTVKEPISVFNDTAARLKAGDRLDKSDALRVNAAAADLGVMADWFKQEEPPPPIVNVTANTKDKHGKAVNGYEVWYVNAYWDDVPEKALRFDKYSTPTTQSLKIGAYTMWTWTVKHDKKGDRLTFNVGASGRTDMSVDLPVPR